MATKFMNLKISDVHIHNIPYNLPVFIEQSNIEKEPELTQHCLLLFPGEMFDVAGSFIQDVMTNQSQLHIELISEYDENSNDYGKQVFIWLD